MATKRLIESDVPKEVFYDVMMTMLVAQEFANSMLCQKARDIDELVDIIMDGAERLNEIKKEASK